MYIVGIDEVGRGSIAGPLVVGAVVLDAEIKGMRDSKLLSRAQREKFSDKIHKSAKYFNIGWVSATELDRIGLTAALTLASTRALSELRLSPLTYILDGNFNYLIKTYKPYQLVVKGDNLVPSISAASIVAKVARDAYMYKLALEIPQYGFERHVGYATKEHLEALSIFGITPQHRRSFEPVKSLVASVSDNSV